MYYAASRDKLDKEFDRYLKPFIHIIHEFPVQFKSLSKAQYIVHRIFRRGGLILKYLNHAAVKELDNTAQVFLAGHAKTPWRFSFAKVLDNPHPDFYEMLDEFSGDSYLLYSPSMSRTLDEHPVLTWFNLIGFNGSCWQSFGPVSYFRSFNANDIYFFATEQNEKLNSEDDLLLDIEQNPVPYMLLVLGSTLPQIIQDGEEIVLHLGEGYGTLQEKASGTGFFDLELAEGVIKITHPVWSEPPHFAEVFYDPKGAFVLLQSMTESGYVEMRRLLNDSGFSFPDEPDICLHLTMKSTIERLLRKKLVLNPYEDFFDIPASDSETATLEKLNKILKLALPYINNDLEPDFNRIAEEAGVEPEIARDLIKNSLDRIKLLRGQQGHSS